MAGKSVGKRKRLPHKPCSSFGGNVGQTLSSVNLPDTDE
jgi:hypothetical protein